MNKEHIERILNRDPEYMILEEDGQEEFNLMWEEGDTVTPDGYTK